MAAKGCPGIKGYRNGCRCEGCKEGNRVYMDQYRERRRSLIIEAVDRVDLIVEGDVSWVPKAACRPYPKEMFFPKRGDGQSVSDAKAICASCDVRSDCLEYALRTDQEIGIWGGTSGRERRAMKPMYAEMTV